MIRINLLPVSKIRKQQPLIIQGVVGLLFLFLVILGGYFVGATKNSEIKKLKVKMMVKEAEVNELKSQVGEVEKFKIQLNTLEQQLGVIRGLEQGRRGPVKMMDELADLVPRKLWLENFREANGQVTLEGTAESGEMIADFLERLKSAKYFFNPELKNIQGAEQDRLHLQKFSITANVKYDL